jgi:hypothetical protein
MFHAVKNDPIPFSVMSRFILRVRVRSAITTISHINLSIKTSMVCSYCQINWQYKTNKDKTNKKQKQMSFRKKCIYYALYVNSITTSEIKKNMYYIDIYNVKHLPFYLATLCMHNIRLSVFNYKQETLHFRVRVMVFNVEREMFYIIYIYIIHIFLNF